MLCAPAKAAPQTGLPFLAPRLLVRLRMPLRRLRPPVERDHVAETRAYAPIEYLVAAAVAEVAVGACQPVVIVGVAKVYRMARVQDDVFPAPGEEC